MNRQQKRKLSLFSSFLLFPIIMFYFSPYIIIVSAYEGIIGGSFFIFTLLFIASLFFGRLFCGHICPIGGMQECLMLANDKKAPGGKYNFIKFIIWIPWLCTIIILFLRAGGIYKIDLIRNIENGLSLTRPFTYIIYYGVLLLVYILALTAGKRAFCHYVCWISPFMIIGSKLSDIFRLPKIHLTANKDDCIGRKKCTKKCPMSLDVEKMVNGERMKNSECIVCGECIDACPKKLIRYSFRG